MQQVRRGCCPSPCQQAMGEAVGPRMLMPGTPPFLPSLTNSRLAEPVNVMVFLLTFLSITEAILKPYGEVEAGPVAEPELGWGTLLF